MGFIALARAAWKIAERASVLFYKSWFDTEHFDCWLAGPEVDFWAHQAPLSFFPGFLCRNHATFVTNIGLVQLKESQ
jgi:hypothetical protein